MSCLLSVLITSFNREAYIAEAIESVLASSFKDYELIIVDDASTDDTIHIARQFESKDKRVKVYSNEKNAGDYPNRNIAAGYARGKYIKYVDSDDKIYPHTLATMVAAMEANPTAALGFCDIKGIKSAQYPVFLTGKDALKKHFFEGGLLLAGPSTSIIKREALLTIGGFSGKRYVSDYEAWLLLCCNNDVIVLPPHLVWLRTHAGQENDVGKLDYYHLNYRLHRWFLTQKECPFTSYEKKRLLYNYRILFARRMLQRIVKWYGLRTMIQTIYKAGERPAILFMAFMPMKKK